MSDTGFTKGGWTKGPWRVSTTDDTVVVDASGAEVAAIDGDYNQPDTWPVLEANARLIASAPDLHKELRDLIGHAQWVADHFDVHYAHLNDALAALRRAEGREG